MTNSKLRALLGAVAGLAAVAGATVAPTAASAAGCPPPPPIVNPFTPWGDSADYVLSSGGTFEPSSTPWTLAHGAAVVAGNDAAALAGPGAHALYLPEGATATGFCTTAPNIASVVRFAVRNVGTADGALHVEILVNGGKNGVLDGGLVTVAPGDWTVSPIVLLPWSAPLKGAVGLEVRLTAAGAGAAFEVDDVYIDPYVRR